MNAFVVNDLKVNKNTVVDWYMLCREVCMTRKIWCVPLTASSSKLEAENISCRHHKNGGIFFSLMSKIVLNRVAVIEISPGEKLELAFIPPPLLEKSDYTNAYDTFIKSMAVRCEACIVVHSGHTPY
ncbi:hypothetical protein TNCV_3227181 [Trichonephila clavipes]|nr:hypothetical protein TNCV_3227181 [Trichonephila clavipes]